jgi:hypothetical protein
VKRNGSHSVGASGVDSAPPAVDTSAPPKELSLPPLTLTVAVLLYEHVKDVPIREHELRCWIADLGRALHG